MVYVANGQGLSINYVTPKGEREFRFCDEQLIDNLTIHEINIKMYYMGERGKKTTQKSVM